MKVVTHSEDLDSIQTMLHSNALALVPTMGALHDGHLRVSEHFCKSEAV